MSQLTANFLLVTLQYAELRHCTNVKHANSLIAWSTCNEIAVRWPCQSLDSVFMLMPIQHISFLYVQRIGYPTALKAQCPSAEPRTWWECPCFLTQGDLWWDAILRILHPIRGLRRNFNIALANRKYQNPTSEHTFSPTFLERPYANGWIITSSRKSPIIRAEAQPPNSFPMPIPCRQIVHVGLEVLYYAALIGRSQVSPWMSEWNSTYCGIVCLEDRLEVESEPIPKRELSTCWAGEHTSTFGCPLWHRSLVKGIAGDAVTDRDNIDRTTNFIRWCVHKLRA